MICEDAPMNLMLKVALVAAFLGFSGCAKNEAPAHDHPMACAKCKCGAMEKDPADASKCKSCGHAAADHTEHRH